MTSGRKVKKQWGDSIVTQLPTQLLVEFTNLNHKTLKQFLGVNHHVEAIQAICFSKLLRSTPLKIGSIVWNFEAKTRHTWRQESVSNPNYRALFTFGQKISQHLRGLPYWRNGWSQMLVSKSYSAEMKSNFLEIILNNVVRSLTTWMFNFLTLQHCSCR